MTRAGSIWRALAPYCGMPAQYSAALARYQDGIAIGPCLHVKELDPFFLDAAWAPVCCQTQEHCVSMHLLSQQDSLRDIRPFAPRVMQVQQLNHWPNL